MSTFSTPPKRIPPFDARTFLRLARELSIRSDDEAAVRTAISRAYYSAFWVARDFVGRQIGIHGRSHDIIWNALKGVDRRTAEDGFRLRLYRNIADYEKAATDLLSRVLAVVIADRIIKRLAPQP